LIEIPSEHTNSSSEITEAAFEKMDDNWAALKSVGKIDLQFGW